MNLKERLARLERTLPSSAPRHEQRSRADLSSLLPGAACENELGCFWRHCAAFDLSHRHGRHALQDFLANTADPVRYVAKDAGLSHVALEQLVFIDTETTGLSGGVGTLAFLVGVGYFEGGKFVIEQYFLRRFEEERPLLHACLQLIQKRVSTQGAIVSFNGKCYDMPLLANRAILHRLRGHQHAYPHIDLLHAARRLWKKSVAGCSLRKLESAVLQIERGPDVPAELIPGIYFDYLRSADPRPLLPVFFHNQADILSMVSLLDLMIKLYADKENLQRVPLDVLAMGRAYEDLRDYAAGLAFYEHALQLTEQADERQKILLAAARLHKRKRDYREALRLWEQAIACRGFCAEPYEELAKAFEHQFNDPGKARHYAARALENIGLLEQLGCEPSFAKAKAGFVWRLKRLERKGKG
jgi:hypothetical protein